MRFVEACLLDLFRHPTAESIVWKAQWIIKAAELVLSCGLLGHVGKQPVSTGAKRKAKMNHPTSGSKVFRYLFCLRLSTESSLFITFEKAI